MPKTALPLSVAPDSEPSVEPMANPANGEPLTVPGALKTLQNLEGLEIGVYQRTEGTTWIVWGLVTAGIFFTYSTFAQGLDGEFAWYLAFLWVPWIAAGLVASAFMWNAAHVKAPPPEVRAKGIREMVTVTLFFLAMFFLGFTIYQGLVEDRSGLREPGMAHGILGLASIGFGFLPRPRCSPGARRMVTVVGVLNIVAVLVLAFVPYASVGQSYLVQTLLGALLGGGGWFLGGIYLLGKG